MRRAGFPERRSEPNKKRSDNANYDYEQGRVLPAVDAEIFADQCPVKFVGGLMSARESAAGT